MSLNLDARQRALLEHMGLRLDFLPGPLPPDTPAAPDPDPGMAASRRSASGRMAAPAQDSAPPEPGHAPGRASAAPETVARPHLQPAPSLPATMVPGPRPDVSGADWSALQQAVQNCTACGLCQTRQQTVFGVGATPAPDQGAIDWMIVGEAPGEQEDRQGEPFVGPAGQLLDQMLGALGLSRQAAPSEGRGVFIANVLKCRPPGNRNPQPQEVAQCLPFLKRQIELLRPKVLLAMGKFGAQALLAEQWPEVATMPLGKLRGQVYRYGDTPLVVTYHPAYLLRTPADKAKAWADLCQAHALSQAP